HVPLDPCRSVPVPSVRNALIPSPVSAESHFIPISCTSEMPMITCMTTECIIVCITLR
ncbi:Neurite extension and migration factor, partial [Clarias magur]